MTVKDKIQRGYMIRLRQLLEAANAYRVSYVPRGLQQARVPGKPSKKVPEYTALVQAQGDADQVQWDHTPADSEVSQEEFDQDARRRAKLLHEWLGNLRILVELVRGWAGELGWSPKVIEKPMEDSEIGNYKAPALLLQEELTKVLLEPIARSTQGTEGVVDLYLLPGYDDIASLYFCDNRWNLNYMSSPDKKVFGDIHEGEDKPLRKASFRKVLEEMRQNAQ